MVQCSLKGELCTTQGWVRQTRRGQEEKTGTSIYIYSTGSLNSLYSLHQLLIVRENQGWYSQIWWDTVKNHRIIKFTGWNMDWHLLSLASISRDGRLWGLILSLTFPVVNDSGTFIDSVGVVKLMDTGGEYGSSASHAPGSWGYSSGHHLQEPLLLSGSSSIWRDRR